MANCLFDFFIKYIYLSLLMYFSIYLPIINYLPTYISIHSSIYSLSFYEE